MQDLATNGILPFDAFIEILDEGAWTQVAKGSSVAWLESNAQEEADLLGKSRIVSVYGTVLAEFTAAPEPVNPETLVQGQPVVVRKMHDGRVLQEYAGTFSRMARGNWLRIRESLHGTYGDVRPGDVFPA